MKDSGVCPKCAATDIVRVPGDKINLFVPRPNFIPTGLLRGVVVSRFVCCGCGYSEEWVESPAALQKLQSQYGSVPQHAEPGAAADGGAR